VASLVDHSLLTRESGPNGEPRFAMLETIHEYGGERLAAAGEETEVRERHAAWCMELVSRAESALEGADQIAWVGRLDVELDNVRAALRWSVESKRGELAQRLAEGFRQFWILRGHLDEGRRWLEQALSIADEVPPTIRARALLALAGLARRQADYSQAPALEEALALFRAAGDRHGVARTLGERGIVYQHRGDFRQGALLQAESLALFRELEDQQSVVKLLINRGLAAYDRADYDQATDFLEEALSLGRSLGSWYSVGHALNNLALVALERHDMTLAEMLQAEAVDLWLRLGNEEGIADAFENFAMFSVAQGQFARAAWLFGAAAALRTRLGIPGRPIDRVYLQQFIEAARADLGEPAFSEGWAAGETMHHDEAIAKALDEDGE
jgi:non-specific serine/threonine protein kinase